MERTKDVGKSAVLQNAPDSELRAEENPELKPRWKKIGGGSFRMSSGRIIKQNQVFRANKEEIPMGFRDVVILLDDEVLDDPTMTAVEMKYEVKPKGGGWFDIVNASGKKMNEKSLRFQDAQKFAEALSE